MVEQALIDMADLLYVQGAKTEAAQLLAAPGDLHLQVLQRLEQMQHRAVVDLERGALPFQKREAARVEQPAAVRGHKPAVVIDAAIDGAEGRQQPRPGVEADLQHLFAGLVRAGAKLVVQRRDGVVLGVERVFQRQPALPPR